ncbi:vegetative incompatibility protein HET-E-1, putative [Rhizoctonia solani AG-3 Rhs1AP]|uniref:Vegetative incompatibility protein HET-E-1, putative n=1 Tax=Rhizoctonia solani AG-3 Rhs1AP TaxID=1086054 RepID=X8JDJ0_9AGAM|nr:vegetative incompatibility protein HET-E-1, putative [Rhizoctonia solani AG-3 Rhs1AP]
MNNGIELALRALHDNAGNFIPLQDAIRACLNVLTLAQVTPGDYGDCSAGIWILNGIMQRLKGPASSSAIHLALSIESQANALAKDEQQGITFFEPIMSLSRLLQDEIKIAIESGSSTIIRLERLSPAKLAYYDSDFPGRQPCTNRTCTQVLSKLDDWATSTNRTGACWMTGPSGAGKTTIAATFSHKLEKEKLLAASFFGSRSHLECYQIHRIIPTIAYQLAHYSMRFRRALFKILDKDPTIGSNIADQFEWLLKKPLIEASEAIPKNLVVVLDALDECDDQTQVELLLSLLTQGSLPIGFFITTRSMTYRQVTPTGSLTMCQLEKFLVPEDIRLYLEGQLSDILSVDQIEYLIRGSGTSFIYATTLARSIRHFPPSVSIQIIYTASNIDELYRTVIRLVMEQATGHNLRLALAVVLYAPELVNADTISGLTGVSVHETTLNLSLLKPLLVSKNGLTSVIHSSLSDFMFNKAHSLGFESAEYTQRIARQCFEIMKRQLRFNICDLESADKPDVLVENFTGRVQVAISPALSYACRYWGHYLHSSLWSIDLQTALKEFLSIRLLFWVEVMNLNRLIEMGPEVLSKAQQWHQTAALPSDLENSLDDACRFVKFFATTPISQSTPHIYISALLFCPHSSFVSKYREHIRVNAKESGDIAVVGSWLLDSEAKSMAYSPNGARIAFGCENGTVVVREIYGSTLPHTTKAVSHSGTAWSVALSPNGQYVASGYSDGTVQIWSISEHELPARLLTGHSDWVVSVAFSPDGELVASGSKDCNIFVWNSRSGKIVSGPLEGHFGAVSSVVFSPGGLRIASGSWDQTIRVWDPHHGTLLAGPFVGHSGPIHSISFSLNGAYLVSGASDGSIGIWDSRNGLGIMDTGGGTFSGHAGSVSSAAFSSDTRYIISGSSDQTIKKWDIPTGKLIGTPLYALVEPIVSFAVSPDRKHIASCSSDRRVQLWRFPDARQSTHSNEKQGKPFTKRWELRSDGWIVAKDSSLLLWVPEGIRSSFLKPDSDYVCTLIGRTGAIEVNLSDLPLDERWRTCYRTH